MMRFLVKATIPVEAGNSLIRNPNFDDRLQEIFKEVKPDAVYFAIASGQRTIYLVVNVADASQLPAIAEPLWLATEADVEFIPVMSEKEFAKAAPHIERAAKKY